MRAMPERRRVPGRKAGCGWPRVRASESAAIQPRAGRPQSGRAPCVTARVTRPRRTISQGVAGTGMSAKRWPMRPMPRPRCGPPPSRGQRGRASRRRGRPLRGARVVGRYVGREGHGAGDLFGAGAPSAEPPGAGRGVRHPRPRAPVRPVRPRDQRAGRRGGAGPVRRRGRPRSRWHLQQGSRVSGRIHRAGARTSGRGGRGGAAPHAGCDGRRARLFVAGQAVEAGAVVDDLARSAGGGAVVGIAVGAPERERREGRVVVAEQAERDGGAAGVLGHASPAACRSAA